jgi:hypothetical protein
VRAVDSHGSALASGGRLTSQIRSNGKGQTYKQLAQQAVRGAGCTVSSVRNTARIPRPAAGRTGDLLPKARRRAGFPSENKR